MALVQKDLEVIAEHIQKSFPILQEAPPVGQNIYWLERSVKVEEELRHQREILEKMMQQIDKRFEQVDKRFEQVDKRFAEMQSNMDKRFEQVDKRFNSLQWMIGLGLGLMTIVLPLVFKYL